MPPELQSPDDPRRMRSVRLLLAENGFANALGSSLGGIFLTGMILSLGGGPMEIGLAVGAGQIGAMGMLLTNVLLQRTPSRKKLCLIDLGLVRLFRIVISLLPLLIYVNVRPRSLLWPMMACLLISSFFGMSAEINRRSWISDLVPPHERGKFFARRVMIGTLVTMSVTLGGARFLDYMSGGSFQDFLDGRGTCPLGGLQILVAFGGLAGIVGWVLLTQAYEPPLPKPRRMISLWRSLALPWLRPRFRGLLMQAALWSLAVGFAADFFNLYMIRNLRMSLLHVSMVNTAGDLAAVLLAPAFGAWADRAGSRKVLEAGIIIKTLLPLAWIGVSADHWQWAFAVTLCNMVNSAMTICWMRLSLNMAPRENQTAFLSMHQAVMGAFTGIGALAGGFIATFLQGVAMPVVWGVQLAPLHVLFLISAALRMISLPMMRLVREPRGAILREARVADPPGK